VNDQLALLPEYLTAHLQLTLFALAAGVLLSVPLGVAAHRIPRIERPILAIASVVQTIPSLALLALMVAAFAALGLQSIGFVPALVGLTLYSLLPILRNTVTGLSGVEAALIEAARGVGMTPGQRLRLVELPLALPVIIAGIRTATVWTVGMATLSTPVGAPSLGNYIFSGLQTRNLTAVLVGSVAAALLALLLDGLIHGLAVAVESRKRRPSLVAVAVLVALYVFTGASAVRGWLGNGERPVRIGGKPFTEQYVLSEILAGQVRRETGLAVEVFPSLGSKVTFDALEAGQIDAYVDYTGTIWATIMHRESTPATRDSVLDEVARHIEGERGVVFIGALGYENTYALAMRRSESERLGMTRISELAPIAGALSLGADFEFFERREWHDLVGVYGLAFRERVNMDPSFMYAALANGDVDVITAYSTDGRIAAFDLTLLDDDGRAFPPYDAVVLASARLARQHPEAIVALRALVGRIDAVRMRKMNGRVDQEGDTPSAVAAAFLGDIADSP
jgi:osmoprotectant transport system permease protein